MSKSAYLGHMLEFGQRYYMIVLLDVAFYWIKEMLHFLLVSTIRKDKVEIPCKNGCVGYCHRRVIIIYPNDTLD